MYRKIIGESFFDLSIKNIALANNKEYFKNYQSLF